jgi:hypothetical protein
MPIDQLASYMECLEIIHSQEALVDLETSSFVNLKKDEKKKILKKYETIAFRFKQKKIIKMEDIVGALNHGG